MADSDLPEGTDHIINGASVTEDDMANDAAGNETVGGSADKSGGGFSGSDNGGDSGADTGAFFDKIEGWRAQGYDKARDYAVQGKDRATGAIDDLLKMINDAAAQVDDKVGAQYGDYARRASSGIESFNASLKGKDVDELFSEARDMVAKAPAVAIGAAAALGFIVARMAKAGMDAAQKPDGAKPKSDA